MTLATTELSGYRAMVLGRVPLLLPAMFLLLLAAALTPILAFKIPILADYPNHLARIYVITHLASDPLLQRFYTVAWQSIPDLAMDLLVPPLVGVFGIFLAGKLFVIAVMLLLIGGVWALHLAIYRRPSVGPLLAFPLLYNWIFMFGLLNYFFSVGLAMWGAAAWITLRSGHAARRGLVSMAFVVLLYASHLFGLGLYGVLLLCYEICHLRRQPFAWRRSTMADLAAFALPFLPALIVLGASATSHDAGQISESLLWKFMGLYWVFGGFWSWFGAAMLAAFAGLILWGCVERRIELPPVGRYMLIVGVLLYLLLPWQVFNAVYVDTRVPVAITLLMVGMMRWHLSARQATLFCLGIAVFALLRDAEVTVAWRHFNGTVTAFERSFSRIVPGSRILVAGDFVQSRSDAETRILTHFASLALIERSAFETLEFTAPAGQILSVKPGYRDSKPTVAMPLPIQWLDTSRWLDDPRPISVRPYWESWRAKYDYVYVLYARPGTPTPSSDLKLVYQGTDFQLYRVNPSG